MPHLTPPIAESRLASAHQDIGTLCDALEAVADALPGKVKLCALARARGLLVRFIARVQAEPGGDTEHCGVVAPSEFGGLFRERRKDRLLAEEVLEELDAYVSGEGRLNADAMGYLLRNFFDRMHHRVALEREMAVRLNRQAAGQKAAPGR